MIRTVGIGLCYREKQYRTRVMVIRITIRGGRGHLRITLVTRQRMSDRICIMQLLIRIPASRSGLRDDESGRLTNPRTNATQGKTAYRGAEENEPAHGLRSFCPKSLTASSQQRGGPENLQVTIRKRRRELRDLITDEKLDFSTPKPSRLIQRILADLNRRRLHRHGLVCRKRYHGAGRLRFEYGRRRQSSVYTC